MAQPQNPEPSSSNLGQFGEKFLRHDARILLSSKAIKHHLDLALQVAVLSTQHTVHTNIWPPKDTQLLLLTAAGRDFKVPFKWDDLLHLFLKQQLEVLCRLQTLVAPAPGPRLLSKSFHMRHYIGAGRPLSTHCGHIRHRN